MTESSGLNLHPRRFPKRLPLGHNLNPHPWVYKKSNTIRTMSKRARIMTQPITLVKKPSTRDWRDGISFGKKKSWDTSPIALPPPDLERRFLLSLSLALTRENSFIQPASFPSRFGCNRTSYAEFNHQYYKGILLWQLRHAGQNGAADSIILYHLPISQRHPF